MIELEPLRVLLVDDDEALLESMAAVLSEQFDVRTCPSADEALKLFDTEAFQVVCADWQMPGMDGIAFFNAVAQREQQLLPCFVLVTAYAAELLEQVPYRDRKILGMLRKPFSPEQLIERVNQFAGVAHLKRSKAAQKSGATDK